MDGILIQVQQAEQSEDRSRRSVSVDSMMSSRERRLRRRVPTICQELISRVFQGFPGSKVLFFQGQKFSHLPILEFSVIAETRPHLWNWTFLQETHRNSQFIFFAEFAYAPKVHCFDSFHAVKAYLGQKQQNFTKKSTSNNFYHFHILCTCHGNVECMKLGVFFHLP